MTAVSTFCASGFRCVVNSRNPQTGVASSNFTVSCALPVLDAKHAFNRVAVTMCVIPKTYKMVMAGSNTFTLQEGAQSATVTIPVANYRLSSWSNVLAAQLNAASAAMGHNWTYVVTFPNVRTQASTGRTTITVANNGGVQPAIVMIGNNLFKQLGFAWNSTNNFVGNSLTATNTCLFQEDYCLYLRSNVVASDGDDILAVIPAVSVGDLGIISYQAQHPKLEAVRFSGVAGGAFSFSLQNTVGQLMDLDGLDFTFRLLFFHEVGPHDEMPSDEHQAGVITNIPPLTLPEQQPPAAPQQEVQGDPAVVTAIPPLALPAPDPAEPDVKEIPPLDLGEGFVEADPVVEEEEPNQELSEAQPDEDEPVQLI